MIMFLVLLGALTVASGSVLNSCEDVKETLNMDAWLGETNFMWVEVEDSISDKFSLNLIGAKGQFLLRVAVFCETGVAKVSHKLKKIWQSLGEGRVKCVRGKMPVVISKAGVWVGNSKSLTSKNAYKKFSVKETGKWELKSKTVTLSVWGYGSAWCTLYPSGVKTCPEATAWFDKYSNCNGYNGFIRCEMKPICDGAYFAAVQQWDYSRKTCAKRDGNFVGEPFEYDPWSGIVAESNC